MKEIKISLPNPTLTEEDISTLLSNAMADNCGFDWWDYKDADYDEAKEQLIEEGNEDYYREDVLARILFNGKSLRLLEADSDWHWSGHKKDEMLWSWQIQVENLHPVGGKWHNLTLKKLVKAIAKAMIEKSVMSATNLIEDGDFYDADAIVQEAIYGEVVFG